MIAIATKGKHFPGQLADFPRWRDGSPLHSKRPRSHRRYAGMAEIPKMRAIHELEILAQTIGGQASSQQRRAVNLLVGQAGHEESEHHKVRATMAEKGPTSKTENGIAEFPPP